MRGPIWLREILRGMEVALVIEKAQVLNCFCSDSGTWDAFGSVDPVPSVVDVER